MSISSAIIASVNKRFAGFSGDDFIFPEISETNLNGFFPYRNGFLDEKIKSAPTKGILVLGQDFGTESYLKDIEGKGELNLTTCRNLMKILPSQFISQVFVSNVFVGLRTSGKITGINKLYQKGDEQYLAACSEFVKEQIKFLEPTLIIALGQHPYAYLKKYVLAQSSNWKWQGFRHYKEKATTERIEVDGFRAKLICIPHPSLFFINQKSTGFDSSFVQSAVRELMKAE